jgi:hypothetical protein
MKRTAVFIFIAVLLMQAGGCVIYTYSTPQPIPGVGKKRAFALRLTLPDIELTVEAQHPGTPRPFGRWPIDKQGTVLMVIVVDPMSNSVQFDPFRVRYEVLAQSGANDSDHYPSVVQGPPARYNTALGRFATCVAKPGSPYRNITGPTRVGVRTCFRLFFETNVSPPTETTLRIEGISIAGKPLPVPPIKFKVRKANRPLY